MRRSTITFGGFLLLGAVFASHPGGLLFTAALQADEPLPASAPLNRLEHLNPPSDEADLPDADLSIVLLDVDNPHPAQCPNPPRYLEREIFRQAFLIAARDELGLATRDGALLEHYPTADARPPRPFHLVVRTLEDDRAALTVFRWKHGQPAVLLEREVEFETPDLEGRIGACERLSRGEFVELLLAAGYQRRAPTARDQSQLPAKVAETIDDIDMLAQFAALRAAHDDAQQSGESPELLGALSRTYSQLGTLCDILWNTAHKIFYARGLLYAERLRVSEPHSARGYWHQAYARALAGRHHTALQAAKRARAAERLAGSPRRPEWTTLVVPFCEFETKELDRLAKSPSLEMLARYLMFLAREQEATERVRAQVFTQLLEVAPDCFRAIARVPMFSQSTISQESVRSAPPRAGEWLFRQISVVPGLPDECQAIVSYARR